MFAQFEAGPSSLQAGAATGQPVLSERAHAQTLGAPVVSIASAAISSPIKKRR
jgi:hypothetical protein